MAAQSKILIIVTTHAVMGQSQRKTGLWFEELSTPYYLFLDAGALITIASLNGGHVPVDPHSLNPEGGNPESVERFRGDDVAMRQLERSESLYNIRIDDYKAVFMPGGHGAMWDLAASRTLGRLLSRAWAGGQVVAALGHGPAGLLQATDVTGRPLVRGRQVSAFPNTEEEAGGLMEALPFLLETRLSELGADFQCGPDFESFAVRDGRLVTGQNPASSEELARLMLDVLGEAGQE